MRAGDIAISVPTVTLDDPVTKAVQVLAVSRLPGLVVVDADLRPELVLPGTQVLRLVVPESYQDDPGLTRAVDEEHADQFWLELAHLTVRDCAPSRTTKPVTVSADATLLEIAALMARQHSPLVAVTGRRGVLLGAVTLERLITGLAVFGTAD